MKSIFLFILLSLPFSVFADITCEDVAEGYEDTDEMYVVCNNLSKFSMTEINQKMKLIMEQYQGEPDEIMVYFVSSKYAVGKPYNDLSAKELIALYYTHDGLLTFWPKIDSRKKDILLEWESSI